MARAVAALARREHSRTELALKLSPYAASEEELARVLDHLEQTGLQSDHRFAQSFVHVRAPKWGVARIAAQLRQKGLDEALIQSHCQPVAQTELSRALQVWQKKFADPPASPSEQARQIRFLVSRGFSSSVFFRLKALGFKGVDTDSF